MLIMRIYVVNSRIYASFAISSLIIKPIYYLVMAIWSSESFMLKKRLFESSSLVDKLVGMIGVDGECGQKAH